MYDSSDVPVLTQTFKLDFVPPSDGGVDALVIKVQ